MNLTISKGEKKPIYKQLEQQLVDMISSGALKAGDRLPSEQELSELTGASNGTVKRAYTELSNQGILKRIQGSGTFVTQVGDPECLQLHQRVEDLLEHMLNDLSYMHLSYNEILSLVESKIQWRRQKGSDLHIAVVDCNAETLSLISSQLSNISDTDVTELILSELEELPQRLTYGYDLILVPQTHYLQLVELAPTIADRIVKVAIEPSPRVKYELAQIKEHMSIGVWCVSQQFANAIYAQLSFLKYRMPQVDCRLESEPGKLCDFIEGKDVLILPFDYFKGEKCNDQAAVQHFRTQGNQVIFFEYHIDRGSLIHVNYEINRCRARLSTHSKLPPVRQAKKEAK